LERERKAETPIKGLPSIVTFYPILSVPVYAGAENVIVEEVGMGEVIGVWPFGSCYRAKTTFNASLLHVQFTANFYQNSQGRRKLQALGKQITETSAVPPHQNLARPLGFALQVRDEGYTDMFILHEAWTGRSLAELLQQTSIIGLGKALGYLQQILLALTHLHANNIVHKDVGADTVTIDGRGTVTLVFPHIARALRGKARL